MPNLPWSAHVAPHPPRPRPKTYLADTQVAGPEVVGPLGEAVGLIDAGKGNQWQLSEEGSAPRPNQRLWRQHQHLHLG